MMLFMLLRDLWGFAQLDTLLGKSPAERAVVIATVDLSPIR